MKKKLFKEVNEEKDLGVVMDKNLKFVAHIQTVVKKANRMLGVIKRTFKYIDKEVFLNLYKAIVRPHLEYASNVWSVIYKKDATLIENVQRRATRLMKKHKTQNLYRKAEVPRHSVTSVQKSSSGHGGSIQNTYWY